MRCSHNYLVGATRRIVTVIAPLVLLAQLTALAQTPDYSNVGRAPTQQEVKAWDIAIGPSGKELPPGSGSAKEGAAIYYKRCVACHGQNLEGGPRLPEGVPSTTLVGGKGTLTTNKPFRTIGSWWPFATTLWDYINRAMPRGQEGSLSPSEVYAVTAFLLYKNDVIKETDVLDAKSLPKVQMPNRNGFIPANWDDIPNFQKRGCRMGHCPQ